MTNSPRSAANGRSPSARSTRSSSSRVRKPRLAADKDDKNRSIDMRALVMDGFGSPDQAKLGELPKPETLPDDLLVRVTAAAVNPVDWKEMAGYLAQVYGEYGKWAP